MVIITIYLNLSINVLLLSNSLYFSSENKNLRKYLGIGIMNN